MAVPRSAPSIRPWQYISLSILMLLVSLLTFTNFPAADVTNAPVFTVIRDPRSGLHILQDRKLHVPPWFYQGLKGFASALWSILVPVQHNAALRKRWPGIHRFSGYTTALLSSELGVAGYYMLYRGWATTHESPLHVHSLYNIALPPFAWPTFTTSLILLGPPYYVSLYKTITSARARQINQHRRWAVLHSIAGYTIAIERALSIGVNIAAELVLCLPNIVVYDVLSFPRALGEAVDAEVAALAWTLASAMAVAGIWAYRSVVRAELSSSKQAI